MKSWGSCTAYREYRIGKVNPPTRRAFCNNRSRILPCTPMTIHSFQAGTLDTGIWALARILIDDRRNCFLHAKMIHWYFNDFTPCLPSYFARSTVTCTLISIELQTLDSRRITYRHFIDPLIPSSSCSKIKYTGMSDVTSETGGRVGLSLASHSSYNFNPVRHWFKSNMARGT